jgi:hypothetical protein
MAKIIIGQNNVVINVVGPAPQPDPNQIYEWVVADDYPVNVGDAFDPKDVMIDAVDQATFRVLYRHENMIRQLVRALRATSTAANNAATAAGLPSAAQSPDMTLDQARTAFKSLIP